MVLPMTTAGSVVVATESDGKKIQESSNWGGQIIEVTLTPNPNITNVT